MGHHYVSLFSGDRIAELLLIFKFRFSYYTNETQTGIKSALEEHRGIKIFVSIRRYLLIKSSSKNCWISYATLRKFVEVALLLYMFVNYSATSKNKQTNLQFSRLLGLRKVVLILVFLLEHFQSHNKMGKIWEY